MKLFTTKKIARAGIVAALYVALSLLVFPIASGNIQFRISEGLTLLPMIFPETIVGLFVGCALSNLITGCTLLDIIFGSVITLVAAIITFIIGKAIKNTAVKIIAGGLPPIILNAFLLPVIWYFAAGELEMLYIIQVLFLLLGQTVSVYLFGCVMYLPLNKYKSKIKFLSDDIMPQNGEDDINPIEDKNKEDSEENTSDETLK